MTWNKTRKGRSLNSHHSVMQLRTETWGRLKANCAKLIGAMQTSRSEETLRQHVADGLDMLEPIDSFWAFPSRLDHAQLRELFEGEKKDYAELAKAVDRVNRALTGLSYRYKPIDLFDDSDIGDHTEDFSEAYQERHHRAYSNRPYFEVLVVDNISPREEEALKASLRRERRDDDDFVYEIVVVPSFEDAVIATLFNFNIQACVIRYGFPYKSPHELDILRQLLTSMDEELGADSVEPIMPEGGFGPALGAKIAELRPELDLYLVTDMAVEQVAGKLHRNFRRVFYREEDFTELDLSILRGIGSRYQTPFFTALKKYSKRPTGVFHALPISRGKSIIKSNWIQDMMKFYGPNIFMAETSSTAGGLDSLLEPTGPLKEAQRLAARAFGARSTYFVTNGTSTGNKIVVQALVEPDDIVLVDHNCHKSHHYGMVLAGARVVYLDSYPLEDWTMYGAVPIRQIKHTLLAHRRAGTLDQVKMLLLTNCTFDGIIYDAGRVMQECLAIKPDLIFLWDEAWFAFARFHPTYRRRTAMASAARLEALYRSDDYREAWSAHAADVDYSDDEALLEQRLMPDPDKVRIRVYATQSTHKRLTALRQGSMIHIYDQDYRHRVEDAFHEAFMTHTSTSPNYQILASLDIGRRQVELEGFEFVQRQTDLAMALRETVRSHPLLSKTFRYLTVSDLIPAEYRPSGIEFYFDVDRGWSNMEQAWREDEFVLDPSHLNLMIGHTGIDGDTFKHQYLMDEYGIQVNKTTRNTVLFMTNIGTTRSSVAYLIEVLVKIAENVNEQQEQAGPLERRVHNAKIKSLCNDNPPLPNFSCFHDRFRPDPTASTEEGRLREAFFMSYKDEKCEYITPAEVRQAMNGGRKVVSAIFVIPYPPGFPILVPGQVISSAILDFMDALDTREIHGYRPDFGFRVFTAEAIDGSDSDVVKSVPKGEAQALSSPVAKDALENTEEVNK